MVDGREDIGPRLRSLRTKAGMSQAALAARIGVAPLTLRRWELGAHPVRDIYLGPLAEALGVNVSDLDATRPEDQTSRKTVEGSARGFVAGALRHIATQAVAEGFVQAPVVVGILNELAAGIRLGAGPQPSDIVTQADAAKSVGVSRQAIHRLVTEGRVTGYPNPSRVDRAPMVSLAEVRGEMGHHAEKAASDGEATADRAPEAIHPLNPQPANADTTPGGSPLPEPRTPAEPASNEGLPDPPWLSDEYVRETFRESSAAATGMLFDDLGEEEQEELIRIQTERIREVWRKKTAEERAEMIASWQKERSS